MSEEQPNYGNGESSARAQLLGAARRIAAEMAGPNTRLDLSQLWVAATCALTIGDALTACEAQLRRIAEAADAQTAQLHRLAPREKSDYAKFADTHPELLAREHARAHYDELARLARAVVAEWQCEPGEATGDRLDEKCAALLAHLDARPGARGDAAQGADAIHQPTFNAAVAFYRGFEERFELRLEDLATAVWRAAVEPKCGRCGHPHSWHRHDDASDSEASFRCIGYDCMAPGPPRPPCGCPDYVDAATRAREVR